MKYRVLWSFGPAPERASDRKGRSRVGGLSGRTTRGRATETEGVSQGGANVRKRAETCPRRVGSVVYTTLPHAPFPAFAAWCRLSYAESRGAGPGRHCCPRRAPVAGFLGDLADVAPVLAFWAGVAMLADLAGDGATCGLCGATCGFLSDVGCLGPGTGPGIRRFFWPAAWDRKPNWRRDGDGSECGLQTRVDRGTW
jgi:hypothetical protein